MQCTPYRIFVFSPLCLVLTSSPLQHLVSPPVQFFTSSSVRPITSSLGHLLACSSLRRFAFSSCRPFASIPSANLPLFTRSCFCLFDYSTFCVATYTLPRLNPIKNFFFATLLTSSPITLSTPSPHPPQLFTSARLPLFTVHLCRPLHLCLFHISTSSPFHCFASFPLSTISSSPPQHLNTSSRFPLFSSSSLHLCTSSPFKVACDQIKIAQQQARGRSSSPITPSSCCPAAVRLQTRR